MTVGQMDRRSVEDDRFEQRARAALLDSADRLPGSVRSQLTQARYAALAAHAVHRPSSLLRRWVPAGALASVALVLFVALAPHPTGVPVRVAVANPSLEDMDMLADSDGLSLNGDQDVDFDFYEWAAEEASNSGSSMGS
jgi:hypothetical protein